MAILDQMKKKLERTRGLARLATPAQANSGSMQPVRKVARALTPNKPNTKGNARRRPGILQPEGVNPQQKTRVRGPVDNPTGPGNTKPQSGRAQRIVAAQAGPPAPPTRRRAAETGQFSGEQPDALAEKQAKQIAAERRAASAKAKADLADTPKQTEFGDAASRTAATNDPNKPQRSTANAAQLKADALEKQRLQAQIKAQGADTEQGLAAQDRINELDNTRRDILAETKPSLNERQARAASNTAQAQVGDSQARVAEARRKADLARTPTGRAQLNAEDLAGKAKAAVSDTARNKARVKAGIETAKQTVTEGIETAKEKAPQVAADVRKGIETAKEKAPQVAADVRKGIETAKEKAPQVAADVRKGVDATKTKAAQGLRRGYQKLQDEALGVVNKGKEAIGNLQSSETPGSDKTRTQAVMDKARNTVSTAGKVAADMGRKSTAIPRAAYRGGKFVATNPGKLAVGGGAEALAQFQEGVPLSEIPGNIGTSTVQGLGASADELANDISALEATGQGGLKGDALMSHGARGLLNLGEYASDIAGAGLRSTFGPKTFSEAYRENTGPGGEVGFMGRMSEHERAAFNKRMNEQTRGDFGKFQAKFGQSQGGVDAANELLGVDPNAPQAAPAGQIPSAQGAQDSAAQDPAAQAQIAQNTLIPGSDQIGTSGFRRAPLAAGGIGGNGTGIAGANYNAQGPRGSFLEGTQNPNARGGGTFSVVGGPAGAGASSADNVAAYDRQTEAVRGLRNAQRAAQGYAPVGEQTFKGIGRAGTQFIDESNRRNMNVGRPDYDSNLTPKQNNSRLANWQAGVDQANIQSGIDPRTGAITGQEGLRARFGQGGSIRNQIAAANLQRQTAKDAFDMNLATTKLGQSMGKDQREVRDNTQKLLASQEPADRLQAANTLAQEFMANPGSPTGQLMLQELGRQIPAEINSERGMIDALRGFFMGGEYSSPKASLRPEQVQEMFQGAEVQSHPLFGEYIDLGGGGRYFYSDNNEGLATMAKTLMDQRR